MIRLVCLAAVLALGLAIPRPKDVCKLSEWSDWSACVTAKLCNPPQSSVSYPMEEKVWDAGRQKMAMLMKLKAESRKERQRCLEAGDCPALRMPDSEGAAACVAGSANGWPCHNIDLISFVNIQDLGYTDPLPGDSVPEGNDCWGWHDTVDNDDYIIVGLTGGSSFVRVTDPENPVVVGFLESHDRIPSTWRDMKVFKDHVFIVSEARGHGMQVYDMTQLRGKTDFSMLEETFHYNMIGSSHNIAVNEENGYVYVVGATQSGGGFTNCNGGLHIIDVNNPGSPQYAGCFSIDGYVHDTQCVVYHGPDTRYTGHEVCFGYNEDSLTLADVTDHENPVMISKRGYEGSRYTHQGWVTEDHTVVLLDDELDESVGPNKNTATYLWDVTNLEDPVLMNTYYSSQTAIDHNQYIKGDLTYQTNYEAGLRILHIDQANYDLQEVAYFDCLPDRTTANFAGTWSNYPYYDGFVAISSIDYGLFLVRPDYEAIAEEIQGGKQHAEMTRERTLLAGNVKCEDRVETETCQPAC